MLKGMMNRRVKLVKRDGREFPGIHANVQPDMIFIDDASVPIEEGDTLVRRLPNGLDESFFVVERGFYDKSRGIPAHYQVRVRKEKAANAPSGTTELDDTMKVFISWSGETSHAVATTLREWLPSVLPFVSPWVSSEDIVKGSRWTKGLAEELEATSYCIVCVTRDAAHQPWVNFEAGAISRFVSESHVSPFLVGTSTEDLKDLPLSMFQATSCDAADMLRLMESINAAAEQPLPQARLERSFELFWPGLEQKIGEIPLPLPANEERGSNKGRDEDGDPFLEQVEEQLLTLVAELGDEYPVAAYLASQVNENLTRTEYHIDRLIGAEYLHGLYGVMAATRYMITEKGRAYLVENDLI